MTPAYAAFCRDEHSRRLARAREAMRRAGLDACICVAPESLFYLTGYDSWVAANGPQALVLAADEVPPVLTVRDVDLPLARESAWIDDLRGYRLHRDDPAARIAEALYEQAPKAGRVGIEAAVAALPWGWGRRLEAALAPAALVDATAPMGALRWRKSPAEIACLRRAGGFAEVGLAAMRRALRPRMTEIALAAEIEAALRRAGSDYWAIPVELSSGPRSEGGHATPLERVIEAGDIVHAEFAGVQRRYHAVAIATLAAGEPSREDRELHALACHSLRCGIAAIRPGAPVAEVEEASLEPLRGAGLAEAATMRFGYGIGIAYPPVWLETLQIARGSDQRLQPGMAFVLHAWIAPPGEGRGVLAGGSWLLAEDGLDMLAGAGAAPLSA